MVFLKETLMLLLTFLGVLYVWGSGLVLLVMGFIGLLVLNWLWDMRFLFLCVVLLYILHLIS